MPEYHGALVSPSIASLDADVEPSATPIPNLISPTPEAGRNSSCDRANVILGEDCIIRSSRNETTFREGPYCHISDIPLDCVL